MGAMKILMKLTILIVLGAALAGVVMLVRGSKQIDAVSYDEWPDVKTNPDAERRIASNAN